MYNFRHLLIAFICYGSLIAAMDNNSNRRGNPLPQQNESPRTVITDNNDSVEDLYGPSPRASGFSGNHWELGEGLQANGHANHQAAPRAQERQHHRSPFLRQQGAEDLRRIHYETPLSWIARQEQMGPIEIPAEPLLLNVGSTVLVISAAAQNSGPVK